MSENQPVVFFGCSMRGGCGAVSQDELRSIQESIETKLGFQLATKHQTQPGIVSQEIMLAPTEVHDREYERIFRSDVCIFEISNPSLGVGSEISDALHHGKPVLCLWSTRVDPDKISGYTRGKKGSQFVQPLMDCKIYDDPDDALFLIKEFVERHSNP
ncbi:MAG: hypothetical protein WC107_01160 [Patescibacteria group bacterium]